jgi:hypothetical protein
MPFKRTKDVLDQAQYAFYLPYPSTTKAFVSKDLQNGLIFNLVKGFLKSSLRMTISFL